MADEQPTITFRFLAGKLICGAEEKLREAPSIVTESFSFELVRGPIYGSINHKMQYWLVQSTARWGPPHMMSASEGEGGHGKADIVREVA